jgi:hypothetical protein
MRFAVAADKMASLEKKVCQLRSQIQGYRQRRSKLTESDTIRVLIHPLLAALGWNPGDVEEVRSEYRHKSSDNPVDVALFLQRAPVLFVEAKALSENMSDRKWLVQTINYANTSGVDWCVLTNGDEWRFYKVHAPVEAESKLFLALQIDSDEDPKVLAKKLALISRSDMGRRAIDALWTDWRVDRQVHAALEALPEDEAFVRLLSRKMPSLSLSDIRDSLRRAAFQVDFPDLGDVLSCPRTVAVPVVEAPSKAGPAPASAQRATSRLPGTKEMFEQGILRSGQPLDIKGHPGSRATVIDGRFVKYRGETLTYNAWGCAVTGWSAIRIYVHAIDADGRLLDDLRRALI